MKEFKSYLHVEKIDNIEVQGIENGWCYIFPKIDGNNSQLWWNDGLQAGSRNRQLQLDNDNAGFYNWAINQDKFQQFFKQYPNLRLYGEWLVPHTLKTYKDENWRNFYVFDVMNNDKFLHYEEYTEILKDFNIDYIPTLCLKENPTRNFLFKSLDINTYLIKDGAGIGEGIVIKNYEFINKFRRYAVAKIVSNEFKFKHISSEIPILKSEKPIEQKIVDEFITQSFIDKEYAKICLNNEWSSKLIPRLLSTIFYTFINEECWNFIKEFKNPTVNFRVLNNLVILKIKQLKKELF